jgi:hypothetical protein
MFTHRPVIRHRIRDVAATRGQTVCRACASECSHTHTHVKRTKCSGDAIDRDDNGDASSDDGGDDAADHEPCAALLSSSLSASSTSNVSSFAIAIASRRPL